MDARTGDLYASKEDAVAAGVPEEHVVELSGPESAIREVANKVRSASRREPRRTKARGRRKTPPKHGFQKRRARQRMRKRSRRANR